MPVNGSTLINNPWTTIFSPFTDLLGTGFYILPITFIALALYVKTRNPVLVSSFVIASGLLLSGGSIFADYPEIVPVYAILVALGFVGLIMGLFFMRK